MTELKFERLHGRESSSRREAVEENEGERQEKTRQQTLRKNFHTFASNGAATLFLYVHINWSVKQLFHPSLESTLGTLIEK